MPTPQRRVDDHYHPEYWTAEQHNRFEDRLSKEVHQLRADVETIGDRLTWILGGLALLAFLFPFLSPWIGRILGVPTE